MPDTCFSEHAGLGVTHPTWQSARDALRLHLSSFVPAQVITLTPEMCVRAHREPAFHSIIRNAAIVVADGVGVVWGQRRLTGCPVEKIPGIELAEWALEETDRIAGRVFLLGGKPEVVEKAAETVARRYPRLHLAGWHHGYFPPEEEERIVEAVAGHRPHLLLVGMGSPKQEIFISKHLADLHCAVAIGVGGSFDVWSGAVKRAPGIIRKTGLEWAYRTLTQPRNRLRRLADLYRFVRLCLRTRRF